MANTIHKSIFADDEITATIKRHGEFTAKLSTDEVVGVFKPFRKELVQEIELIREVSKDLQRKKDDEMNRIAAAKAEEAEEKEKTKKDTEVKEVIENESA